MPFYDHGWSKINEPGQSVTNVPFYDHGWSSAGTSAPRRHLNSSYSTTPPVRPFNVNYGQRQAAALGNQSVGALGCR